MAPGHNVAFVALPRLASGLISAELAREGVLADQERWRLLLDAVVSMAADLSLDDLLGRIVEVAAELSGAQYAALGVLDEEGGRTLRTFVTHGMSADQIAAVGPLPTGHGLLGRIIEHPEPLRLKDLREHPESYGFPAHHPPMHSFLGVPVRIRERVFGNLYLTEKVGGEFTGQDEELVVALASAAGVAVENARLRDDERRLALLEDRDRIARDLHDLVIQRLFATGLRLQSGLRPHLPDQLHGTLDEVVDELDATIRDIRRTIFALGVDGEDRADVQTALERLVDRAAGTLKFRPELRLEGPLRTLVPQTVVPELLAVLGELLSNVSRHAGARHVQVRVAVDQALSLEVADDGRGMPRDTAESGLANVRARAARLGGSCTIESTPDSGTRVTWQVPLTGS